jgi:8-oxo-dGTP pyrophosphatase MutT (NUDIX family)
LKNSSFVICICPKSAKLLLGRNIKKIDQWEFFGGCAKKDESPGTTAQREFKEETGLQFPKDRKIFSTAIYEPTRSIRVFVASIKEDAKIKLNKKEHSEYGWFSPDKLPILTMTAKKILNQFFIMNIKKGD